MTIFSFKHTTADTRCYDMQKIWRKASVCELFASAVESRFWHGSRGKQPCLRARLLKFLLFFLKNKFNFLIKSSKYWNSTFKQQTNHLCIFFILNVNSLWLFPIGLNPNFWPRFPWHQKYFIWFSRLYIFIFLKKINKHSSAAYNWEGGTKYNSKKNSTSASLMVLNFYKKKKNNIKLKISDPFEKSQ